MSSERIVILGGGGHASVVVDVLEEMDQTPWGITDPDSSRAKDGTIHGVEYLGDDDVLADMSKNLLLVNGIASTQTPQLHQTVYERFKDRGLDFLNLEHPNAYVAETAKVDEGSQLFAGGVVQPNAVLGENVIINTGATVDHDSTIADHSHVAPGATISGNVRIESSVHVGAGAVVLQNTRIGKNTTVGAGAVVIDDVPPDSTVAGTPAEVIGS